MQIRVMLLIAVIIAATLGNGLLLTRTLSQIQEDLPVRSVVQAHAFAGVLRDVERYRLAVAAAAVEEEPSDRVAQLSIARDHLLRHAGPGSETAVVDGEGASVLQMQLDEALRTTTSAIAAGARDGSRLEEIRSGAETLARTVRDRAARVDAASLTALVDGRDALLDLERAVVALWSVASLATLATLLFGLRRLRTEASAARLRQQLREAIDAVGQGFALFDRDDRLVMHNLRYIEFYPDLAPGLAPGTSFDDVQARFLSAATDADDLRRREAWNEQRTRWRQHHPGEPHEARTVHGRWLLLADCTTSEGGTVSLQTDITEAKRREEALAVSEARFRRLSESSPIGIYQVDPENRVVYANPAMCRLLGCSSFQEVRKRPWLENFAPESRETAQRHRACRDAGRTTSYEAALLSKDGKRVHVVVTGAPLMDDEGQLTGIIVTMLDVTARKEAEAQVRHLAEHDALSGLANRALFSERLQAALSGGQPRRSFAVLLLDIDHFKSINEEFGHRAGDAVLRRVARRLEEAVRSEDLVARFSGDEFAILLNGIDTIEDAQEVGWKIVRRLREPFRVEDHVLQCSASAGMAQFPQDGGDVESLLHHAELALIESKATGRNACTRFEATMSERVGTRRGLEAELSDALANGEFHVVYQPQVELSSGLIVGAEALLRWVRNDGRNVPPSEFIPLAESSGLIVPIGEWVLQQAAAAAVSWQRDGLGPLRISVNLSTVQVRRADLLKQVRAILDDTGLGPHHLELEITEGVLLDDTFRIRTTLRELRDAGIALAIDDFGVGFSSLGYLKRLPVDRIKIDRSFVGDLGIGETDDALVRAVIGLGHSLGMGVIAEGVENPLQLDLLQSYGCDEVQGFYLGRPMSSDLLAERLRGDHPLQLAG